MLTPSSRIRAGLAAVSPTRSRQLPSSTRASAVSCFPLPSTPLTLTQVELITRYLTLVEHEPYVVLVKAHPIADMAHGFCTSCPFAAVLSRRERPARAPSAPVGDRRQWLSTLTP